MKILLIDDSALVVERLQEMLAPLPGVEVVGHATDIPEVLRSLRASSPDVVLLDLHLPGGSGIKVMETIRKEKPAIIVIVLTNYAFPQYEKRCAAAGAHSFLDKSKDFTRVPGLIQELSNQMDHRQRSRSTHSFEFQFRRKLEVGSR
jgi:DNA-binding NarL/FixJ family response regulator